MPDNNVQKELESVRGDLKSLQNDVASLVGSLQAAGLDKLSKAGEAATETAEEQLQKLRKMLDQAKAQGSSQLENLQQEVSQHPLASVAAAFAIGYLTSKLLDKA